MPATVLSFRNKCENKEDTSVPLGNSFYSQGNKQVMLIKCK